MNFSGDVKKKKSLIAKEERYKCAVTHDILNNGTPVAVLRPTGDVVTVECVEKIIKKDMTHPLTGITLKDKDIIYLQRGGTRSSLPRNSKPNTTGPTWPSRKKHFNQYTLNRFVLSTIHALYIRFDSKSKYSQFT